MPKSPLIAHDAILESHIIDTMIAGLKQWRSDLQFPESISDMQACVRGLLAMYKIERRPLPVLLKYECHHCDGIGILIDPVSTESYRKGITCPTCKGKKYL